MDARMKGFEDMVIQKDDKVFYQTNNEKAGLGPAKVLDGDKNWIFVAGNGDIKKVPKCNVELNVKAINEGKKIEGDKDTVIVNGPCPTYQEDKIEKKDKNEVRFEDSGMMTCSKKRMQESESVSEDAVATYWMTAEHCENFESIAVYTVEIPAKEQNTPEVKEAKHKEIENLVKFVVFEEVDNCGQERLGSRGMLHQKRRQMDRSHK